MSFSSPAVRPTFSFPSLDEPSQQMYVSVGIVLLTALVICSSLWRRSNNTIPSICGTGLFSSYAVAIRFPKEGNKWLNAGYDKYKPGVFRIPGDRWYIIVTGKKLIEELCKAPDDVLSITEALAQTLQAKFTIGSTFFTNRYHVALVRSQLTRNLGALFSDIREEIMLSIKDNIPMTKEWTSIKTHPAVLQIICRATNRIFVGAPLCRNPEYVALNIQYTLVIAIGARLINFFPGFLKPLAAKMLTNVPALRQKALKHLRPIIEERQKKIDEYGRDYPNKPNDFLSWLMNEAEGKERSPLNLTSRILQLNFTAIHTTAMAFTHALLHLAAEPEYLKPLRNEIETIVSQEGWSKASLSQMHKLDSFFKESARISGFSAITILRVALKDFTFSDGTVVPKGMLISAAASVRHRDSEIYSNGDTFDGFRFSDLRKEEGEGATNQLVSTSPDYLSFGHGRHACPGRFFVANEMKLIMAHLILTYDIKMENEGVRPQNTWFGLICVPDTKASVLFRRRQT